jgi:hypothetical protein
MAIRHGPRVHRRLAECDETTAGWEHRDPCRAMKARWALLPLLVPTAVLTAQAGARPQSGHAGCEYGHWSRPDWLETRVPWLTATSFPTAAVTTATQRQANADSQRAPAGYAVGVAGFSAIEFPPKAPQGMQWPPLLRAIRFDGTVFNRPVGGFWYAHPRATTDVAGTLHVVWAEPDESLPADPRALNRELPMLHSVWYATLHDGKWSRAERIFRRRQLRWDNLAMSQLVLDRQQGLHIAFSAVDSTGPEIVYLRSISAPRRQWRSTIVRHLAAAGYLDLAVGPERSIAIALVAGVAFPTPRRNVLSLLRSGDGGATWTPVIPISTLAEEPAIEPHLFFDQHSSLRLEWVQQPAGRFVGGHVWQATLDGMRRGPSTALALPSDVMTSGSRAALDSCGTIHVFTQAYPHGGAELWYTRFSMGGWTPWSRPFDMPGAHASMAPTREAVHVVWSSSTMPPDGIPISALAHSTLPLLGPRDTNRRH